RTYATERPQNREDLVSTAEVGLAQPSLSSIVTPAEAVGYQAAALLDRILQGGSPPPQPILLPSHRLVVRQSSDLLSVADPYVAAALRFIRARCHVPLRVAEVSQEVPVSQRTLETRFRHLVGRSLGEEIRRVHLQRAKELLATTSLSIS